MVIIFELSLGLCAHFAQSWLAKVYNFLNWFLSLTFHHFIQSSGSAGVRVNWIVLESSTQSNRRQVNVCLGHDRGECSDISASIHRSNINRLENRRIPVELPVKLWLKSWRIGSFQLWVIILAYVDAAFWFISENWGNVVLKSSLIFCFCIYCAITVKSLKEFVFYQPVEFLPRFIYSN